MLLVMGGLLVLPAIESGLKERNLRRSALEIAAVARDLHHRAIYQSALQRLVVDPYENAYAVGQGKKVFLAPDVQIVGIDGGEPVGNGSTQFVFYPNGSSLGGEITISGSRGSAYFIRMEPLLGKVVVIRGK